MNAADQLRTTSAQLKNILFAADFSPISLHAFPFAASIARHYDGRLLLEHVTPTDEPGRSSGKEQPFQHMQSEMEAALTSEKLNDIPHEMLFDRGDICSRLLATAKERGMDLIVVGTHGLRGMKKVLKGSTAEEIIFLATCPVLTTGPKVDREADFKRILFVTDFSPAAENAIAYALSLAEAYQASLLFLHINDWSSNEKPVDAQPRTFKFVHEQLRRSSQGAAMEARSQVKVDFGPRTDLILQAATDNEADLIVMGLHAGSGIKARLATHLPGSMTYDVIAQSPCPVLTVPLRKIAHSSNDALHVPSAP